MLSKIAACNLSFIQIEIGDDLPIKLTEVEPIGQFNGSTINDLQFTMDKIAMKNAQNDELGGPINITISVRLADAAKEGDKKVLTVNYGTREKH
ncbi:unnamed protein product [Echinostoma caproni]|uniref:C2 domain-containing protein n=1 Tax=Echinostoma caproni TaxID=27848 RepID=A0A183BEY9_9TREM|nr:unnamed protein product [Echinostoma caproni]